MFNNRNKSKSQGRLNYTTVLVVLNEEHDDEDYRVSDIVSLIEQVSNQSQIDHYKAMTLQQIIPTTRLGQYDSKCYFFFVKITNPEYDEKTDKPLLFVPFPQFDKSDNMIINEDGTLKINEKWKSGKEGEDYIVIDTVYELSELSLDEFLEIINIELSNEREYTSVLTIESL